VSELRLTRVLETEGVLAGASSSWGGRSSQRAHTGTSKLSNKEQQQYSWEGKRLDTQFKQGQLVYTIYDP
jgi:hypothetical protein